MHDTYLSNCDVEPPDIRIYWPTLISGEYRLAGVKQSGVFSQVPEHKDWHRCC